MYVKKITSFCQALKRCTQKKIGSGHVRFTLETCLWLSNKNVIQRFVLVTCIRPNRLPLFYFFAFYTCILYDSRLTTAKWTNVWRWWCWFLFSTPRCTTLLVLTRLRHRSSGGRIEGAARMVTQFDLSLAGDGITMSVVKRCGWAVSRDTAQWRVNVSWGGLDRIQPALLTIKPRRQLLCSVGVWNFIAVVVCCSSNLKRWTLAVLTACNLPLPSVVK